MKKFFRTMLAIALAGGLLGIVACNKDYGDDVNQVRSDLTAALAEQKSELEAAIREARQAAAAADAAAAEALADAQDYAEQEAAAAQAAAEAYADGAADAAYSAAIAEAQRLADAAQKAAQDYADAAAAAAAARVNEDFLLTVATQISECLSQAQAYADLAAQNAATDALAQAKQALAEEIAKVEGQIDAIDEELNTLKNTHSQDIADIRESLGEYYGMIEALQEASTEAAQRIAALEEFRSETTQKIEELQEYYDSWINELSAKVDENYTELSEDIAALDAKYNEWCEKQDASIAAINTTIADLLAWKITVDTFMYETDAAIEELNGDITRIDESIAELSAKLDTVEAEIYEYIAFIASSLQQGLDTHEQWLNQLESDMATMEEEIYDYIAFMVSSLNQQITDLGNYVASLEEQHGEDIANLETWIAQVEDDLATYVSSLTQEISRLDTYIGSVEEQLNKALEETKTELNNKIDTVNTTLNTALSTAVSDLTTLINNLVSDLENRVEGLIQSITFVPEYSDDYATAYYYWIKGTQVLPYVIVKGTFEVSPKEYAKSLLTVNGVTPENVSVAVVPTKDPSTRAAAAVTEISGENLIITEGASDGLVDVEILLPAEDWAPEWIDEHGGYPNGGYPPYSDAISIALKVTEYVAETETTEKEVDTYISSSYVQVIGKWTNGDRDLLDMYILAIENEEGGHTRWGHHDGDHEDYLADWYDAADPQDFFKGYEIYINDKYGDRWWPIEEFAEFFHVDPALITPYPVYDADDNTYTDKAGNPITDATDAHIVFTPSEDGTYVEAKMYSDDPKEMQKYVGETATTKLTYVIEDAEGNEFTTPNMQMQRKYTITKHITNVDVVPAINPDATIDWTYAFAVDHTSATAYDKPIEFDESDLQIDGESVPTSQYNIIKVIQDAVAAGTWSQVIKDSEETIVGTYSPTGANGAYVSITSTAGLVHNIVDVNIYNYADLFPTTEAETYTVTTTYPINDYEEFILTFDFTLGPKPETIEVDLGEHSIDLIGTAYSETKLNKDPYKEALAGFEDGDFTDLDQFKGSLYQPTLATHTAGTQVLRVGATVPETITNGDSYGPWTRLEIDCDPDYNSFIRMSSSTIRQLGESYSFVTTINTWYGVEIIYTATSTIQVPSYKLAYVAGQVDETDTPYPSAKLALNYLGDDNGDQRYMFETVDLNDYFHLDGAKGSETLRVVYENITEPSTTDGIANVPFDWAGTSYSTVFDNGTLGQYNIVNTSGGYSYNGYTATECDIYAVLQVQTRTGDWVEINRLPLRLFTDDPMTMTAIDAPEITRTAGTDLELKMWQYLDIRGVNNPDYNIICTNPTDPTSVSGGPLATMLTRDRFTRYDAVLTFGDQVSLLIDGQPYDLTGKTYTWDPTTGIFTYRGDNGMLDKDVEVVVEATLTHRLDWNHVKADKVEVSVILKAER